MIARAKALLRDETVWRFIKFLVVGGLNTGFGYAVYALSVLAGVPSQYALIAAYVIGVTWNYFTYARLVFDAQGWRRLPAYVLVYFALYGFNAVALAGLTGTGLHPLLAQACVVPFAAVLSFIFISKALTGQYPLAGRRA